MRRISVAVPLSILFVIAGMLPGTGADRTVSARVKFFGAENVDQDTGAVRADRVILSWFGVTNFAAALNGHVVLLDAWVPRGEYSGYVPTSPAELADLHPEFIIAGHSHFDHTADAAEIVKLSHPTIVGTPEHCDQITRQAAPSAVVCVDAVPRGSNPGTRNSLDDLIDGVKISVIKHIHSAAEPPDPNDPHTPAGAAPDAQAVVLHLPAPQDTQHLASHLADGENGTLAYRFELGDFSFVWHDSSGPLKQLQPSLLEDLKSFRPVDVQLGAIMGFNQITNGFADPRTYVEALQPKIFVPTHHDNWAPGITTRGENYQPVIQGELDKIPAERRPTMRFISDPQDYLRPEVLTFDPSAPYWKS